MLNFNILGLMSGSSLDGVDLAMVEFSSGDDEVIEWKLLATHEVSFDGQWKKRLATAARLSSFEFSRLDAEIGMLFGEYCSHFIETCGIEPDYIASHGHTIFHSPDQSFSVQIGSPSHIASNSNVPVISEFRNNDMAHGGQGAPLAPIVEKYLFAGYDYYLNLGGIANLSVHDDKEIKAWDICPCNQLLNFLSEKLGKKYDNNGEIAYRGQISEKLMSDLGAIIPLPLISPFSLDNSFISSKYLPLIDHSKLDIQDKMRTCVNYICASTYTQVQNSININKKPEHSLLITGGGAHNDFLVREIRDKLSDLNINVQIPGPDIIDFKEAILMALCGLLRIIEVPNALASVTGASNDTINGGIYLP